MEKTRRTVRAIALDNAGNLILIKRIKPGLPPYWTAPGGGIEDSDPSPEEALRREIREEIGARAIIGPQVFPFDPTANPVASDQLFFTAYVEEHPESVPNGPEMDDPTRGSYEIVRLNLRNTDFASLELKPLALKEFVLANREMLLSQEHPHLGH